MSKYGNKPVEQNGLKFASKREAARYAELQLLEKAGKIKNLRPHPEYKLQNAHTTIAYGNGRIAKYTADSEYFDLETHELVTEDVKSRATHTTATKLRVAVFESLYARKVRIVT